MDTANKFTPREQEYLKMVWDGLSYKQISHAMGIHESTVKTMRKNMLARRGWDSTVLLLRAGVREGILTP